METCNESDKAGSFDHLQGEGKSGDFDDFGGTLALKKRIRRDSASHPGDEMSRYSELIDDLRRVPQPQRERFCADTG